MKDVFVLAVFETFARKVYFVTKTRALSEPREANLVGAKSCKWEGNFQAGDRNYDSTNVPSGVPVEHSRGKKKILQKAMDPLHLFAWPNII